MKKLLILTMLIIVFVFTVNLIPQNATDYLFLKFKNDEKFAVNEIIKVEEFDSSTLFVYKTNKGEICFIAVTKLPFNNFRISSSAFFNSKHNDDDSEAYYCLAPKKCGYEEKDNINYFVCVRMNCKDTEAYFNDKKLKTILIGGCLFAYNMFLNESEPKELIFTYK